MKKLLKIIICAAMTAGCYYISRFLEIAPLVPVMLTAWGISCFVFSFELAGSKTRTRNGLEEKTPLHLFWILAGVICLLMAGGVLFYNM
jgi:hypothetical protein